MLLLTDVAKLFWRDGIDRSMLESPLLDARLSSGSSAGNAHAKPFVGAAAIGSGIPDTLLGFGLMTGALRGGWLAREPALGLNGDNGDVPLGLCSLVMPRCCWRFDTRDTLEAFWLS